MNTYKIIIQANINKVSLKDYAVNYVDVQAESASVAVANAQKQYGENFIVEFVSAM